ncbi:931e90ab-390d-405e-8f0f-8eeb84c85efd [Thermothielavioides terrestris]|uniref:931e90ab-390d-405e-8f0f-8eeb84c85efd n=1 Tax=Thermothielavioides terrestris TaxID=2587410 RepID=A0A3S4EWZ8_9PEZI|nr:931e90ab-390d-405e-8f0f-8eeb84c85efd [Thermothielavioides terrestris]
MATQKQFNVGIVGYGLSAKVFHIPFIALTPSLKLHSIVQRSPSPTNSAPADHPHVTHHTAFEALLADGAVDVVVLCTPPDTHFAFARAALEAGKHVLVEKPFVPTAAEADALAALARSRGRVLCVYQNRRWDADFLTVRRLLRDGVLGRVVEFETHFDRLRISPPPGGWKASMGMREGGGALFDLGTHLLDQVFVLFGMPSAVYGRFVRQREGRLVKGETGPEDEPDSVTAVLSYAETGVVVHVRIGVVSVETRQIRFWVRGSKGSYHKTGLDPQEDQLRGGGKATDADFGREDESRYGRLCLLGEDGTVRDEVCPNVEPETYVKFYELFAKAVESGKEEDIPVPASQAAQVLRIIEAIRESAKTGREVAL